MNSPPCEAGNLYAEALGMEWSAQDAASELTSFDAAWLAEEELDGCYMDGDGFDEVLDWIDENGVGVSSDSAVGRDDRAKPEGQERTE